MAGTFGNRLAHRVLRRRAPDQLFPAGMQERGIFVIGVTFAADIHRLRNYRKPVDLRR
ncbi:hypothetical protein [Nocardia jiangsuensis]|uniref:Uncharacterized protein n=1 Tax=Nocardia jiangsuensis TaxID=1691563 RepID=A0ABV8DRM5_9NOCA